MSAHSAALDMPTLSDVTPVRVTIQDARELGFCVGGTRSFMERHGLDFKAFLRDGLDATDLLATGDAMAERVVVHAQGKRT
jgi:hypothetical protein